MPPSSLPMRPNLEHLRKQAKDLLKAYRSGQRSALARFRASLPRLSQLTDAALVRPSLSLGDAQRVVAAEYGFSSWLGMRNYVERKDRSPMIESNMIEMTVDHVKVNNVTNLRVVVLKEKESDRYLPIWIGQAEGDAIAMKLQGQEMPRPLTHRIMDSVVGELGGYVDQVVVTDLVDGVYFANVRMKHGETAIDFDVRPSDAIALAVHSGTTVFGSSKVLDKAGVELDPYTGEIPAPIGQSREYSEQFQGILEVAGISARGMTRNEIEPEDMLLALVNAADSAGAKTLLKLGADLKRIGEKLLSETVSGEMPMKFSERSRRVIESAKSEASGGVVGTEHLLASLALADDGLASAVLKENGVTAGVSHGHAGERAKRGQGVETED